MKCSVLFSLPFVLLLAVGCGGVTKVEESTGASHVVQPPLEVEDTPPEQPPFVDLSKQEEEKVEPIMRPVYFEFDEYHISDDMKPVLISNADYIRLHLEQKNMSKVLLEGNTDEFGSSEYNFALGLKRAIAVRDALHLQGINKVNIDYVSYGKTSPVCTEKTRECYSNNRRVDFVPSNDEHIESGAKIDRSN